MSSEPSGAGEPIEASEPSGAREPIKRDASRAADAGRNEVGDE
ncbi:hypothetical protein ACPC54_02115 [Kitasatospora sp. NPDC094028]